MNDSSGFISPRSAQAHPRRPPAHKSVSLQHTPPAPAYGPVWHPSSALSSPSAASDEANPPSSLSPKLALNKHSSGESSDASKWFETTNNNPKQSHDAYTDNEPPFSLRNSSSADTPPNEVPVGYLFPSIPYRPTLNQFGTDASSDDFRGVIDDLTIANKKLRQKLKRYEKLYDEHLQEDKLFEVRFHGLPDHKKKELGEALRKFAAELDDGVANNYPQTVSRAPVLEQQHTTSSTSRAAESGYVSMTASAPNSSARSNPTSLQEKDRRRMTKSQYNRQQQSIQSYLHDMPSGQLQRNKALMTEKSKKKLIVRRLEQIFAGKRSTPGPHQQPLQQEEVAQSAATADRREREATGKAARPEGLREAHIMSQKVDNNLVGDAEAVQELTSLLHIVEQDLAGPGFSPDQRPTRPLDLDPSRAQVSAENMKYIRHLGFTPPNMNSGEAPTDGNGWIYLNLLVNMAQLHIYNVTLEFVKDAIQDYSFHLEVSRDGRKVRWTGGREITRNSSDNSSENYSSTSPDIPGSSSPQKRSARINTANSETPAGSEKRARIIARAKRQSEQNKFAYKPMFFHKEDSEEYDDYYGVSMDDCLQQQHATGDSSGIGNSAMQSHSWKPKYEDGPIIFYTKAKFYTDLSGDRLGASVADPGFYQSITNRPLGDTSEKRPPLFRASTIAEPRGPMETSPMEVDSNAGSGNVSSASGFGFSPEGLEAQSGNNSPDLMDFEVSGLGGVQPDDNFSIHVKRTQLPATSSGSGVRRRSQLYPKKILDILVELPLGEVMKLGLPTSSGQIIKEELISAIRKNLPSSILPPASFLPFGSTSSGDIDSDLDSEVSSEVDSDSGEISTTALRLLNISPHGITKFPGDDDSDSSSSDLESEYSDDSDGSVDLLATARRLDLNTVLASEREYDAALAERLAENILAGSSAATAGGGSGFNSPAFQRGKTANIMALGQDGNVPDKKRLSISSSISSRKSLKRTRMTENFGLAAKAGSKRIKSRKIGD